MACDCKRVEKIQNLVSNANGSNYPQKGFMGALSKFWNIIVNIFAKIFILFLFVVITPIVILILCFNFIFKGKATLILPKKLSKHLVENNKEMKGGYVTEKL